MASLQSRLFLCLVTRQQQFCCIFAATKDKFDYFSKKLVHSSTLHTWHQNSSWFLSRHKNIYECLLFIPDYRVPTCITLYVIEMDEQKLSQLNFTRLTLASFELEVIEEWIDPFDSTTLRLLTVIVYFIEVLASIPMIYFVAYETGGSAGHFRTVINQLLSFLYGAVRMILL